MVSVFSSNSQQERKLSTFPKIQMSPSRAAQNNKLLPSQPTCTIYYIIILIIVWMLIKSPNCYLCTGLLPLDRTRWAFFPLEVDKKILRPIFQNFNISFWNLSYNNVHKFLLFSPLNVGLCVYQTPFCHCCQIILKLPQNLLRPLYNEMQEQFPLLQTLCGLRRQMINCFFL